MARDVRAARAHLMGSPMGEMLPPAAATTHEDPTRTTALTALCVAVVAIAIGYGAAFNPGGTPAWGPWLLALGIPISLGAIMILGAARGQKGIGRLKLPFLFVVAVLAIGLGAALALPATESQLSRLWLGLPARAAVVIYGIGLLPIVVLPIAYALTFETQTLTAEDVERVRAMGKEYRERASPAIDASTREPSA